MNQFISRHKHHLLIFALLLIIVCVSGYYNSKISNIKYQISNQIQNPNKQNEQKDSTSSLNHDIVASQTDDKTTTTKQQNNGTITVKQFNNLTINSSDYQDIITATSTVYDMMDKLQSQGKFSFKTKEFPGMGYFVEEINGVKNDQTAGKYWIYYINGKSAQVGISNYILKLNDIIEWKYETANL